VAATDSMQLDSCTAPASLQLYLTKHGQHLNSFSLKMSWAQQLMHLPCSRLQELRLHGGKLQPAVLHAPAATLTKLVLESRVQLLRTAASPGSKGVFLKQADSSSSGYFAGGSDWEVPPCFDPDSHESGSAADDDTYSDESSGSPMCLSPLAQQLHNALIQLSSLQHLELEYYGDSSSSRFGSALPHLTALTHLKLLWWCINPSTWRQNLSTLTALRVLHLDSTADDSEVVSEHVLDGVQHLQLLTALRLKRLAIRISQHSSSTLGRLTGLQELDLDYSSCDLSALSAITGLRSLALYLQEPEYPTQENVKAAAVDKHQLQAMLLRQQHLTYFSIGGAWPPHDSFWDLAVPPYDDMLDTTMTDPVSSGDSSSTAGSEDRAETDILAAESAALPGMEVFQAFTASSCLQHLDLSKAAMQFQTWQYLFPAGRQALQLTCLQGPSALYDRRNTADCAAEGGCTLSEQDVKVMVRCCPNLQALEARNVLHISPELGPLQQLTRLEAMWGSDYWSDNGYCCGHFSIWGRVDKAAAARALAGLTDLRYLSLAGVQSLGVELCTALLQLTRLTWLGLRMHSLCRAAGLSDAEAGLLARLTGLSVLSVPRSNPTDEQLLQLAALPQLTKLRFSKYHLGPLLKASVTDIIVSEVSWGGVGRVCTTGITVPDHDLHADHVRHPL